MKRVVPHILRRCAQERLPVFQRATLTDPPQLRQVLSENVSQERIKAVVFFSAISSFTIPPENAYSQTRQYQPFYAQLSSKLGPAALREF
ncbi:hypothetical protein [Pantoea sp. AV62]|uniref:hypothetical protein n=1 Tax=Pantoea sp. AV62 TaxID=1990688 RepID=UPI00117CCB98|nr:hypothetical protein [Pantoea sp. AV62]